MKRIIPILLSLVLVISLAVPVFASEEYPSFDGLYDTSEFPYYFLDVSIPCLLVTSQPTYIDGDDLVNRAGTLRQYVIRDGEWYLLDEWTDTEDLPFEPFSSFDIQYSNYDILSSNGDVIVDTNYFPGTNYDNYLDQYFPSTLPKFDSYLYNLYESYGNFAVIETYEGRTVTLFSECPIYRDSNNSVLLTRDFYYEIWVWENSSWVQTESRTLADKMYYITNCSKIYLLSHELSLDTLVFCDGSSCPATDPNHDNICDDCGTVLHYNLRSTLLEYAKAKAEEWSSTWPYYSIVEVTGNENKLNVYMSNVPQKADEETGKIVTSANGLNRFSVETGSDGVHTASGNYGEIQWTGTLAYANHDIENFLTAPLAVIIQGVTGEALELTLPSLRRTIHRILLCGIGCLALLIVLKLFGKRSLIFRG